MNSIPAAGLIARALRVAEKHLGIAELSRKLGAPEALIHAWQMGHASMPLEKFPQLVDVLVDLDPRWTEWDESSEGS